MTIARAHLVDPAVTRWYHCVTRCVRRAFLLGEGMHDRKSWIEHRLEELAEIFSVAVAGFAILDNHLHLLVRLIRTWPGAGRMRMSSDAGDASFRPATRRDRWPRSRRSGSRRG